MKKSDIPIKRKRGKKWSRRATIQFLERCELYISSGLSIDKTLSLIAQGIPPRQAACIHKVQHDVTGGLPLSASLVMHMGMSLMLTGLIEHGERSGGLVPALVLGRKLLEQQDDISRKVLSALMYPLIIGIFATILTIGLVRGVMPQIIPMLKSLQVTLPLLTRVVIFMSENLVRYGVYILVLLIGASTISSLMYRKVHIFRRVAHTLFVRAPIIGNLSYRYALSIFLRSMGTLADAGVPVVVAYDRSMRVVSLGPLSVRARACQAMVAKGIPLGSVIGMISRRIPLYIPPLLLAGEASGTLGASLIRSADIIDRDLDHSLKRLTALVEPTMMIAMGGMVGAIALSIMLPIYDISRVLQR